MACASERAKSRFAWRSNPGEPDHRPDRPRPRDALGPGDSDASHRASASRRKGQGSRPRAPARTRARLHRSRYRRRPRGRDRLPGRSRLRIGDPAPKRRTGAKARTAPHLPSPRLGSAVLLLACELQPRNRPGRRGRRLRDVRRGCARNFARDPRIGIEDGARSLRARARPTSCPEARARVPRRQGARTRGGGRRAQRR